MHLTILHVVGAWLGVVLVLGLLFLGIREMRTSPSLQRGAFSAVGCLLCAPVIVPSLSQLVPWPLGAVIALAVVDDRRWLLDQSWMLLALSVVITAGIFALLGQQVIANSSADK